MNFRKSMLLSGVLFALIAVVAGAFGSHGLKSIITATQLDIYKTANTYQFYHAFAIMFVSILNQDKVNKLLLWSFRFFVIGIILFSGSLYLLSVREVLGISSSIGAITPFGGLFFITGWILLFIFGFTKNEIQG